MQQTFSANIHEILQSHFFMKYPMGEIAREVLDRIITLYGKRDEDRERALKDLSDNKDYYYYVESIIADPYSETQLFIECSMNYIHLMKLHYRSCIVNVKKLNLN
ncbi:MAG: hypothetical protein ACLUE2_09795 [Bacteroides cellulosilyticus]